MKWQYLPGKAQALLARTSPLWLMGLYGLMAWSGRWHQVLHVVHHLHP